MDEITLRIARLERSASRWRVATFVLVAALGSGMLMGQIKMTQDGINTNKLTADRVNAAGISAEAIVAHKIMIADADGVERITLGTEAKAPYIEIKDKDGKTLFSLSTDGKNAAILIKDVDGKKLFAAP